jgi:AcrR family transcriptional regulator
MDNRRESETKRRIRQTAMRLFQERSFEEVTLNDICEASGVNRHTFYYHFKSKDDLLDHYHELPWELSAAEVADILMADNFVDQLWLITKKFIDFVDRIGITIIRQILVQNITKDARTFHPNRRRNGLLRLQEGIIQKGQAAGQFQNGSDPHALVILLQQTMHSTCFMWTIMNGCFDYSRHMRYLFEALLDVAEEYREMKDYAPNEYTCFRGEAEDQSPE